MSFVTEYTPKGEIAWEFTSKDIPDVKLGKICGVNVLPSGNIILGLYRASGAENGAGVLEINREKKVMWRFVQPKKGYNMMSCQKLDAEGKVISTLR